MNAFDIIFYVVTVAFVGWLLFFQVRHLIRRFHAAKWPTTIATIREDFVGVVNDNGHAASFQYEFAVQGKLWSGQFLVLTGEDNARKLLKDLNGQTIQVRYNPRRPDISFLTDLNDSRFGSSGATQNPYWLREVSELPGTVINLFRK